MAQPPARVDAHEVQAAVTAHKQLGPEYDQAIAEGLVERIGEQIDARIDARLGKAAPVAVRAQGAAAMGVISILGGAVMTGIVAGTMHASGIPVMVVGWGAIAFINMSFNLGARHRQDR